MYALQQEVRSLLGFSHESYEKSRVAAERSALRQAVRSQRTADRRGRGEQAPAPSPNPGRRGAVARHA